jgi:hypothetical protein
MGLARDVLQGVTSRAQAGYGLAQGVEGGRLIAGAHGLLAPFQILRSGLVYKLDRQVDFHIHASSFSDAPRRVPDVQRLKPSMVAAIGP